jgi:ABC-2 type transport system permease protein
MAPRREVASAMSPDLALTAHLARRTARRAIPWGLASAVVVFSSAATYQAAYSSAAQRLALAASLESNSGLSALFGPARDLDTVWGFTAWRSIGLLTIVGGVWGVLAGARLLRGEEDAGRWELVLAGVTSRTRAAAAGIVAGWAGLAAVWSGTVLGVLVTLSVAALPLGSVVAVAVAILAPGACTMSVTVLLGQVVGTRRGAARAGAVFFAAAYLLRVVSIAAGPGWLGWLTPFGWVDRLHPLSGLAPAPACALLALLLVAVAGTLWLAGKRDLGAGLWQPAPRRRPSTGLLRTPETFAVHETLPALLAWCVGLAAVCTVLGLVSRSVATAVMHSATIRNLVDRLGAVTAGSRLFLGLAMTIVISAVAFAGATFASALETAETKRLLEPMLSSPVTRTRWLVGRLLVGSAGLAALGALIGASLWLATAATGAPIAIATMLNAGANTVPVALFVLGIGALVFGIVPRAAPAVAYGLVAWSFLVELVGALASAPNWLMDLSLLHHVAVAPAAAPRWNVNLILVAVGLAAAAAGTGTFRRRDISG